MQFLRISSRDCRIPCHLDILVESLHIRRHKRWSETAHLIDNAPERPDVAFVVVGLIPPNLWASIIGCSRLCVG
jgi:hypothetical protein